ncbi:hypothetical protein MAR_032590 [Mya arenaria]|uniref:Uncharacterized protein n=1 Tax=Mya arenaria TaxID=6604 RepID=A0ABY7FFG9_MYAAR|nr:hypothetical protein MAR_032590 [Mya arenaria]
MRHITGANLQADREEVWFMSYLFRENMEENVYLRESKPLFDLCEHVFAHFEQEVEKDMDKAEGMMNNDNVTRKLSELIRKLTRKVHKSSQVNYFSLLRTCID